MPKRGHNNHTFKEKDMIEREEREREGGRAFLVDRSVKWKTHLLCSLNSPSPPPPPLPPPVSEDGGLDITHTHDSLSRLRYLNLDR